MMPHQRASTSALHVTFSPLRPKLSPGELVYKSGAEQAEEDVDNQL